MALNAQAVFLGLSLIVWGPGDARITDWEKEEEQCLRRGGMTWHTLRHTFASRWAMTKYREGTIAVLLRHSSTSLVKRYAHLSQDHLKRAVEDVAGFRQHPKKAATEPPTVTKIGNGGENGA
jgi:integrase